MSSSSIDQRVDQPVSHDKFAQLAKRWRGYFEIDISTNPDPDFTKLKETIMPDCLSITHDNTALADRHARFATNCALAFYPLHSWDLKILTALYTTAFISLDDQILDMRHDVQLFRTRLLRGEPQPQGPLALFAKTLTRMEPHYGTLTMDLLVASTVESIASHGLESSGHVYHPDRISDDFPRYFRWMTGFAQPYGLFLPARHLFPAEPIEAIEALMLGVMPEMAQLANGINDVLSFYKESVVGTERANFIYMSAAKRGVSPLAMLENFSRELFTSYEAVMGRLEVNLQLREVFRRWVKGETRLQFIDPRYRLMEVDLSG
ncbi:terpenoid synthase [Aspergillus violaceofuscus CBS 115571]|uniref:Terpenoid synthase n=1 Tax=Aspergillus violaceofuscus (strain CBS 115571) TaxID=1450538 RepID=A0A2V5HN04_ASPV1|nr:terpenoid synthase [Aspergillus violaceofuscus CBS 115571]